MADPSNPAPAESFSTASVARRLGVSIPTVQRWVDQGHLKAWKTVGGHRRIDARSVFAFEARALLGASASRTDTPLPAGAKAVSVLVVDDNPVDRDLLAAVVMEALPGARLALAGTGFEALLLMGHSPPDVLVTDIVMPHMDGLEMLRHLTSGQAVRPPLIVATSSHGPDELGRLGALPPDVQFVPKPIDAVRLIGLLRGARPAPG
ncbi:MAG: response regulator [Rubrivivax sp.]|nr:response regulator [Rubrivivax sp.]